MFIRTERLFLRPSWPEEVPELLALINDRDVARNLSSAPWPYTACDAAEYLAQPAERLLPRFFITLPSAEGARLVGCIGLAHDAGAPAAELGYWIGRAHWDQGYATEAVRAVISLARALGHARLDATHYPDNPAAARVLEKCGFVATGERRLRCPPARGETVEGIGLSLDLTGASDDEPGMRAA